jgi:hypothetical protein
VAVRLGTPSSSNTDEVRLTSSGEVELHSGWNEFGGSQERSSSRDFILRPNEAAVGQGEFLH